MSVVDVRTSSGYSARAAASDLQAFQVQEGQFIVHIDLFALQAVQPKAGTPGTAQETPAPSGGAPPASPGSSFMMIAPMLLIMVPILFMSMRRQKKESLARSKLKKGDRVMTQSGLIGKLLEMDERLAKVEIAPGVKVEMLSTSVSPLESAEPKKADEALKDLKDAKAAAEKK